MYNSVVDSEPDSIFDRLLKALPEGRQAHSRAVGRKATLLSGLIPRRLRPDLVTAAYLHDIGYSHSVTGFHPIDGARFLAEMGFSGPVCHLVAHHTASSLEAMERGLSVAVFDEFAMDDTSIYDPVDVGLAHGVLWWADLTTGPAGEDVDVKMRLSEICARYGPNDPVTRFVEGSRGILIDAGQLPIGSIQVPVSLTAH